MLANAEFLRDKNLDPGQREELYGEISTAVNQMTDLVDSLLEFSHALPGVQIIPHPVFPEDVKSREWWLWSGAAGQVLSEYHKYLAALARSWIDRLAGR